MATSVVLGRFSRLLASARLPNCTSTRSKFYVKEPVHAKPNWLKVGLSLVTSGFLWAYLINQHNEDVLEYKRRNGLE
ncbi:NADH dehydrogenase [ubiquinone] 1 subunit C1, mitochondrial [Acomys russatus]|uniref:NADH dehydrogenase [ubiquinone] 1 subunit C1, mitochondrial n=1 Tax=Acomys russatus TaxID=60746 RepID=UPI0021E21A98|nr:NADH dehydrogenase [ubiquinone] 1 subunit C1, mitochondrial [Acomys russatus]